MPAYRVRDASGMEYGRHDDGRPEIRRLLDRFSQVVVSRDQDDCADRVVPSEGDHVEPDTQIDVFLLAVDSETAEPESDVRDGSMSSWGWFGTPLSAASHQFSRSAGEWVGLG